MYTKPTYLTTPTSGVVSSVVPLSKGMTDAARNGVPNVDSSLADGLVGGVDLGRL